MQTTDLETLKDKVERAVADHFTGGRRKWTCQTWEKFVRYVPVGEKFRNLSTAVNPDGSFRYTARFQGTRQATAPDPGVAVYVAALLVDHALGVKELLQDCRRLVAPHKEYKLSLADREAILKRARKGEKAVSIHKDYPQVTYQGLTDFLRKSGIGRAAKKQTRRRGVRTLSKRRVSH